MTDDQAQEIQITQLNAALGGFGSIHFGIHRNNTIAIKEQKVNTELKILALLKEMAIMGYCDHKNIAKISAVYFHSKEKLVWIVQPKYYITLASALNLQKIQNLKKIICTQILVALQYLHNLGLVHLDLKPLNIMFKTNEMKEIVLLDFGISNVCKENEGINVFGMTPAYCPPEITFAGLSFITPKADIFSFGIILYEIITEKRAFSRFINKNRAGQIHNFIRSSDYDFFAENQPTNNKDIDEFIRDCTNQDISQRPTATEALKIIETIQFD